MATTTRPEPRLPDDRTWRAVLARDARRDGRFVYAVVTTGIYCRPSCPARRPARANARIFACAADARREGFRPCRRCRPDDGAAAPAHAAVERARRHLDAHPGARIALADLARVAGLSPAHLQRAFTRHVGLSPRRYQERLRYDSFRRAAAGSRSVLDAAFEAGFGSSRAVYASARRELGMTPGAYRRGGAGVTIVFGTRRTALGVVLAAATPHGICAIALGDDEAAVEAELVREFPAAVRRRDDAAAGAALDAVEAYLAGGTGDVALPLDVRGTEFQRAVWSAIRSIRAGTTTTYGAIARGLGRPSAARAVARACGQNRIAMAIPCHRVQRGDGGPGGYRWGVERKKALLAREQAERG